MYGVKGMRTVILTIAFVVIEFRTKLLVNWKSKQKEHKTIRFNEERVKDPKEWKIYQSKIANKIISKYVT